MHRGAAQGGAPTLQTMAKHNAFLPDRIEDGKFVTRAVLQLMRELNGCQVEVCIRKKRNYTTYSQHKYYRGVVVFLVAEEMRRHGSTGPHGGPITDEECHQLLATKFLRRSLLINAETGESEDYVASTADLTTAEMSDYITSIKVWAHIFDREVSNDDGSTTIKPFIIPEAGEQLTFV